EELRDVRDAVEALDLLPVLEHAIDLRRSDVTLGDRGDAVRRRHLLEGDLRQLLVHGGAARVNGRVVRLRGVRDAHSGDEEARREGQRERLETSLLGAHGSSPHCIGYIMLVPAFVFDVPVAATGLAEYTLKPVFWRE